MDNFKPKTILEAYAYFTGKGWPYEGFVQKSRFHEVRLRRWEDSQTKWMILRDLYCLSLFSLDSTQERLRNRHHNLMLSERFYSGKRGLSMARIKSLRKQFCQERSVNRKPLAKMPNQGIRPNLRIAEWAFEYMDGKIDMQEVLNRFERTEWPGWHRRTYIDLFIDEMFLQWAL